MPSYVTLHLFTLVTNNTQWYAEVLHFCRDVPILLVGCKKDLRYDNKVIEELAKTSQSPVSPEQVRDKSFLSRNPQIHKSSC